ncbi:spore coat protein [Bacillus sp. FJAT-29790]|uniref:spore coat protein n=1 Tax=Bacillus sp. FJAT-29790 TaxID=1895002 RepID=UPI001C2392A4|nr:spore coat protein [Bacillus sp. FJAT-29790]MBU8880023.1 spore coat protein [Bacillus sp. FJAT-29790]
MATRMWEEPNDDGYLGFLDSLIGRTVKVYRGGPESKEGILLDVKPDFLTLYTQKNKNDENKNKGENQIQNQNQNQNNHIIYYRTHHVKSISENSKSNSQQDFNEMELDVNFVEAEDFRCVIENLKNKNIRINQGGPESTEGLVLEVVNDYIVLHTENDGVVYFNIHHIKSVSENSKMNNNECNFVDAMTYIPRYIQADCFHDLFSQMSQRWVSINRGGPEAMEGILVETAEGHYTLVNNEEVLRIHPFHIRSINTGSKGSFKQNQNNDNNGNQENEMESDDSLSGRSDRRSGSRHSHRRSHRSVPRRARENVTRTVDYMWRPRRS